MPRMLSRPASCLSLVFLHHQVRPFPVLVESCCARCGKFIAVSPNRMALATAERAHKCPAAKQKLRMAG